MSRALGSYICVGILLMAGCSNASDSATTIDVPPLPGSPATPTDVPLPELDAEKVAVGADLYAQYCSSCHGADLKGDPDWRVPNEDGSYPPPPQDSSGHTWHHSDALLSEIILVGSDFPQSRMPAYGAQLTESDVAAILEFFKSTWGPQERTLQWQVTLREASDS